MFLLSDLISQVRELLQDEVEPYRYPEARLYRTLNTAFTEAYRIRPDIFVDLEFKIPFVIVSNPDAVPPIVGNEADVFQLDQQFYQAFVDFVTSMTEFSDDEWTVDGRAGTFLQLFNAKLGGPRQ